MQIVGTFREVKFIVESSDEAKRLEEDIRILSGVYEINGEGKGYATPRSDLVVELFSDPEGNNKIESLKVREKEMRGTNYHDYVSNEFPLYGSVRNSLLPIEITGPKEYHRLFLVHISQD
jgi:hypothetical protein